MKSRSEDAVTDATDDHSSVPSYNELNNFLTVESSTFSSRHYLNYHDKLVKESKLQLYSKYKQYVDWLWQLQCGANLFFYGYGCHKYLLDDLLTESLHWFEVIVDVSSAV